MKIPITGSTGLIGSRLIPLLIKDRHQVFRLVRRTPAGANEISWDPSSGTLDISNLEGMDAVVHLAGENIAGGRWTAGRKLQIRESRIKGTSLLARSLARLFDPPGVMISVSAIGFYGNRGEGLLDEGKSAGKGFLPDLCREWEAATSDAAMRGIRVVIPRIGIVLSAYGGALALMLPIFRMGIGGRIGSGRQYISWIDIDDLVGILYHAINLKSIQGPVNAVSPNPVTNRTFSKTLGQVLSRPVLLALPAFAARAGLGQMAEEALLSSARVLPKRLVKSNYRFAHPELEGALRHILQKPKT